MSLDMFTVIMGLLLGGSLTLALHFLCRWDSFLRAFGVRSALLLYLLCVLRTALPVKLPFTVPVGVPALDSIAALVNAPLFQTGRSLGQLFMAVWLAGAAVSLLTLAAREIMLAFRLHKRPGARNFLAESVLDKIRQSSPQRLPVRVRTYCGLKMPVGVGLFRPLICLPRRDYTERELGYILRHEYAHFLGRDLWVKLLAWVYAGLFWWNPAAWLLLRDIGRVLELRCDRAVTKSFTMNERREYLTVILRSVAEANGSAALPWVNTPLVTSGAMPELLERFLLVADPERASRKRRAMVGACALLLFAGSYSVLFQPSAASNCFILPESLVETPILLAICAWVTLWALRSYRSAHLPRRRAGALATAAAVLITGLGVYRIGYQAGLDHAPVTATVISWDGSQSGGIAIDTEHFDSLTSLDVHDVLCTSEALGENSNGPYQFFSNVRSFGRLNDVDTMIMAANSFSAVSAVPEDSVEYGPGLGPEFLTGSEALCAVSDHYAGLAGLKMGGTVTVSVYTKNYYSYGEAYQYVGQKTLRIGAVYPFGLVDRLRAPDMVVPVDWLRGQVERAGEDFCYSSLSAKLDNYRQVHKVWSSGFVPEGTAERPTRYSNTVAILA